MYHFFYYENEFDEVTFSKVVEPMFRLRGYL